MTADTMLKQLANTLEEFAYLFAEYVMQCEYEALVLEHQLGRRKAGYCN